MTTHVEPAAGLALDEALASLRRAPKVWTEDEVLEAAYDPAHLRTDQLFDYCENKLDEDARREVEAHAARCDFCTHQLAGLIEVLPPPHPDRATLIQFAAGVLPQEEREWVEEHLAGPCAECAAFLALATVALQTLVDAARRGAESEQLARVLAGMVLPAIAVRVRSGAFADEVPYREFTSEDGALRVILQQDENDSAQPVLVVEVTDEQWSGDTVTVSLIHPEGNRLLLAERVTLESCGGGFWEGSLRLSPDVLTQLPENVHVLAAREA